MKRHWIGLLAVSAVGVAVDQGRSARRAVDEGADGARHVILVVSDGLRWQEVFRGADSALLFGDPAVLGGDGDRVRRKYWRATVGERRAALMPFVWGTLSRDGQLLGNRDLDSRVAVTNGMKFSYPGYNEMLVGYPDPRIDSNEHGPNPNVTVFEWLHERREFRGRVAAFGTWDTFRDIFNVERSGLAVYTNGAKPHDAVVQGQVLPYLKEKEPRAVFVGFAETDDWGHEGRYDRFLDAAHAVDAYMAELWSLVQAHPRYRGRTTVIFTTDHGRGRSSSDWTHHGERIAGAEETFIAMIGPGIESQGERRNTSHSEGQVAGATASAAGLNVRSLSGTERRYPWAVQR